MISLTFLGVEGYPQGDRETISILVDINDYRILLDCGASIIKQLDRAKLLGNDIDALFLSHLHADHSSGVILLLYSCLMEQFEKRYSGQHKLCLIGNQHQLEPLMNYCKAAYPALFRGSGTISVDVNHIDSSNNILLENGVTINVAPMSHAVVGQSVALSSGDTKICYSADTRITDDLINLATGSNVLICNVFGCDEQIANVAGFMSAVGAAKLANRLNVDKLIMLHLNDQESRDTVVSVAKQYYDGVILAPNNGERCII